MLTIITGTPGAGKTLLTLHRLKKENEVKPGQQARQIFIDGVPECDHGFFGSSAMPEPEQWFNLPDGSILFFDEGQRIFPQRPASQGVPRKCQEFATHRHKGMDIYIATQDASNIDAFVRRMCGRHLHVHRILNRNTATIYEYDHYESRPTGYHEKKAAVSVSAWSYPKKMFDKYKSATMHTYKARTPFKLYFLAAVVLVTGVAVWKAVSNFSQGKFTGDVESENAATRERFDLAPGSGEPGRRLPIVSAESWLNQFKPRVKGIMHSAPIYDQVASIEVAPIPLCVISQPNWVGEETSPHYSECKCYTQQITHYETSDSYCRSWAQSGYFDPTRKGGGGGSQAGASRRDTTYKD